MSIKIVNANNSASDEIADINEAVAAGAKEIILNTIQESVTATAEKAMKAGIPVVTVDRDVSNPTARDAFIGDNDETLGREETQYGVDALAKMNMPKPWHVVVLQGTLRRQRIDRQAEGGDGRPAAAGRKEGGRYRP